MFKDIDRTIIYYGVYDTDTEVFDESDKKLKNMPLSTVAYCKAFLCRSQCGELEKAHFVIVKCYVA